MAIIARRQDDNICFLALRNNPVDPAHGGDFYYVVTGNVDEGEGLFETILREIEEETGIRRILHMGLLPIEKEFIDSWGRLCHETFYAIVTDEDVAHLSEEHIEHKWLVKDSFVRTIKWYGPREELGELLDQIERTTSYD